MCHDDQTLVTKANQQLSKQRVASSAVVLAVEQITGACRTSQQLDTSAALAPLATRGNALSTKLTPLEVDGASVSEFC